MRILLRRYAEALPFSLAYQGFEAELAALPAPYKAPEGCLLIAKRGSEPVGTVGLKRLRHGVGEIKRLYVAPAERRSGIGKMLLTKIIDEAQERGYDRVWLDSHRPSMSAAIGLYRNLGFVEIAPYGPDLDGELGFFEKSLRDRQWRLEECRASFEASLREAPQDEAFFLIISTIYTHAEERPGAAGARLEARTAPNAA